MEEISEHDVSMTATKYGLMSVEEMPHPTAIFEMIGAAFSVVDDTYPGSGTYPDGETYGETYPDGDTFVGLARLSEHTALEWSVRLTDDRQAVIVVKLQSERLESDDDYKEWFETLDAGWSSLGMKADWRINMQGLLSSQLKPDDVWKALEVYGVAADHFADEYRDGRTVSKSAEAPFLYGHISAGGQTVNLQTAVHQSTENHTYRITMGTPLITIEY